MKLDALFALPIDDLRALVGGLRSGRLEPPFSERSVARLGIEEYAATVADALGAFAGERSGVPVAIAVLEALMRERARRSASTETCDPVWTGADLSGESRRDTGVVVRELFQTAQRSVLVAGYVVYKGQVVLAELARRMDARPELSATFFLDIGRASGDTTREEELVARFARRFRSEEWPGERLPKIYFDPRSLALDPAIRASLHAKCVVIDSAASLVTSANLTRHAQERNVELGLLVRSERLARQIETMFSALVQSGRMRELPL